MSGRECHSNCYGFLCLRSEAATLSSGPHVDIRNSARPRLTAAGQITPTSDPHRRFQHSLRWAIGGLLFTSTVINYLDRQTLSILAPFLKVDFHWTNTDYAAIVIAFRIAYSLGQTICGRLIDRVGTRRGITLTVAAYSLVSMLTPLARGLYSFAFFSVFVGRRRVRELAGGYQGRIRVVSEKRAWAGHGAV